MSDLGQIAKDAAQDVAEGAEKAGKAVIEHYQGVGGELKTAAGRYRGAESGSEQGFLFVLHGGAKSAEGEAGALGRGAEKTASSEGGQMAGDASSAAAGQDLKDVLDPAEGHQIKLGGDSATGDVSTAPGEAVFWSGATELKPGESVLWPGAKTITTADGKTLLLAGEDNAKTIARADGKVSLESLIEDRGISMQPWSDDPAVQQTWKDVSDRYALGVSGDVHVVLGESLRPGNIWETVERPRLEANPAVTSITKIDLKTLERTVLWRRGG